MFYFWLLWFAYGSCLVAKGGDTNLVTVERCEADHYDSHRNAIVTRLCCNYTKFCLGACTSCSAQWTGTHHGRKTNFYKSSDHAVIHHDAACMTEIEVLLTFMSSTLSFCQCKVRNSVGKEVSDHKRLSHRNLKVQIVAATANITAHLGEDLAIVCPSRDPLPPPNMSPVRCRWSKDGYNIPTNGTKYEHSHRRTLIIKNMTESDGGVYHCLIEGRGVTKTALDYSYVNVTVQTESKQLNPAASVSTTKQPTETSYSTLRTISPVTTSFPLRTSSQAKEALITELPKAVYNFTFIKAVLTSGKEDQAPESITPNLIIILVLIATFIVIFLTCFFVLRYCSKRNEKPSVSEEEVLSPAHLEITKAQNLNQGLLFEVLNTQTEDKNETSQNDTTSTPNQQLCDEERQRKQIENS